MACSLRRVAGDKSKAEPVRTVRRPGFAHFHQSRKRGSAVKRKLASVLVALAFGWLSTAAFAEEESTATSADSSTATSEPAAATEESTDTATVDTSTSDGTIAATPAETGTDTK
jgi:hypothetical protein